MASKWVCESPPDDQIPGRYLEWANTWRYLLTPDQWDPLFPEEVCLTSPLPGAYEGPDNYLHGRLLFPYRWVALKCARLTPELLSTGIQMTSTFNWVVFTVRAVPQRVKNCATHETPWTLPCILKTTLIQQWPQPEATRCWINKPLFAWLFK